MRSCPDTDIDPFAVIDPKNDTIKWSKQANKVFFFFMGDVEDNPLCIGNHMILSAIWNK